VVMCYVVGLLMGNLGLPIHNGISQGLTEATVLLAIPLLLFATDFRRWLRSARPMVISFFLTIFSVMVVAGTASFLFSDYIEDSAKVGGMLVGVYTGGTPNLNAIGLALGVGEETMILVNAAEMTTGALYLLFLMTVAKPLLGKFLRPYKQTGRVDTRGDGPLLMDLPLSRRTGMLVAAFALAVAAAGISVGISLILTGELTVAPIILSVTSIGIALSFVRKIRNMPGPYELGQYLLLVFCVALGTRAEIGQILRAGPMVFAYITTVLVGSVTLHILLAKLFRIDVDTVIITSTAAVYGPPFVGPIVSVLGNKEVLVGGMTCGLIGIALGNYLGIGLAWLLGA
jgi:uncharacterized membrane protein